MKFSMANTTPFRRCDFYMKVPSTKCIELSFTLMAELLKLEIVTPEKKKKRNPCIPTTLRWSTCQAIVGQFGVFPQHAGNNANGAGRNHCAQEAASFPCCGRGTHEVTPTRVAVLTDLAVSADRIDERRPKRRGDGPKPGLRDKLSGEEIASVNPSLARSLANLRRKKAERYQVQKPHSTFPTSLCVHE